jgi:hypothetical protein
MTFQKKIYGKAGFILALVGPIITSISCVTTHVGKTYSFAQAQIVVSCANDSNIRHDYIKSITCTIENTGDTWAHVKISEFNNKPQTHDSQYQALTPNRIQSFLTAYNFEVKKNNHNANMIFSGLVIGSAIVASTNDVNTSQALLGAGIAGAMSTGTIREMQKGMALEYGYGEDHLLGPMFELPPTSFVRKTILLDPTEPGKKMGAPTLFEVCFAQPTSECQLISLLSERERIH